MPSGNLGKRLVSSAIFNIVSHRKASILLDVASRPEMRMSLWASRALKAPLSGPSVPLSILLAKESSEGSGDFNAPVSSSFRGRWASLRTRGTQLAFVNDT